ncbi:DUF1203 domain-containing protein [Falsiphaeobacter marinintestinus]|uniref:DUF1203 domain-containing protein n=1 Tax=Falsiphaeobacter marinintestinus TaxID=1492905 RepID=UPI0011B43200|nr:DUF1203 domain-containing protein [Phaeobacter marinintestinus]
MTLKYYPFDTDFVTSVRTGGPDANGQPAEQAVSSGGATPCRYCLAHIPEGAAMLVLAARPFPELQPYAETGPIFLCADCAAWAGQGAPEILTTSPDYLLKGYNSENRIVYGTGKIVPQVELVPYAETLLSDPQIAYVDVRSSRNNCFLTRITEKT